MKHGALVLLFGSCAVLSGCATITNQGNRQIKLEPNNGHSATVLAEPILVTHFTDDARIYEGNQQLVIHLDMRTDSATFFRELQECERGQAELQRANPNEHFANPCGLVLASIWLDTHTPHMLRIVQGGRQGTVIIRSRTHWWPWVWVDFLLGPAAPVGLLVDALTGKWTYYGGSIDVEAVLGTPSRGTR
jgi:hypothetical protein